MPEERWEAGHPTREELKAFLLGRLDRAQFRAVLAHLAGDCAECSRAIAPLAEAMLYPTLPPTYPPEIDEARYDFVIRRAIVRFCRDRRREAQDREPAPPAPLPSVEELLAELIRPLPLRGEEAWGCCEALLAESWELRRDDPEGMLDLAMAGACVAQGIDPACRGPEALADLQCRAIGLLANARRAADEPWAAEADFAAALQRFDHGTGDPLLLARLMDLTVSMFREQQRFEEAEVLSEWAAAVYVRHGEHHAAGRVLVNRARVALFSGKAQEALSLAHLSLKLLDRSRDPHLTLAALHNLAYAYADCGKIEEADAALWEARPLYAAYGGALDRLRLVWLEGRIAAGRGHHGRAERSFRAARDGFAARNLPYTAAVAALDLGILLFQRGRTDDARAVVTKTVATFNALHIDREAHAALLLLSEAARQERLTVEILKSAARHLAKLQK